MTPNAGNDENLREAIAFLGAQPFHQQVVQTPWSTVRDVPSLHEGVKQLMLQIVGQCSRPDATRCLTIFAPSGYGKTHLFAWLRQQLDAGLPGIFVSVSPFRSSGDAHLTAEQHVLRAAFDALWTNSQRQRRCFETAIRGLLVRCYDRLIDTRDRRAVRRVIGVGSLWDWLFGWSRLRIGGRPENEQLAELRRAITRRPFLERAFQDLQQANPDSPPDARLDWDTFVASCLLACGDEAHRWQAYRWLQDDPTPLSAFGQYHLDRPCRGSGKMVDGLYTLGRLVGRPLCVAFDQLEDTFNAFWQPETGNFSPQLMALFGGFIATLCRVPSLCLFFGFQQSLLQPFMTQVPAMLRDRMTEGHGAQVLQPMGDAAALAMVREYMRQSVWAALGRAAPDPDGLYPFSADHVREARINNGGEIRPFLQAINHRFHAWLRGTTARPPPVDSICDRSG